MSGYEFKCRDLGYSCKFEVAGVKSREEIVDIIKNHGKRCHDLNKITPEIETKVAQAIRG